MVGVFRGSVSGYDDRGVEFGLGFGSGILGLWTGLGLDEELSSGLVEFGQLGVSGFGLFGL
jgi:hypothetical protein